MIWIGSRNFYRGFETLGYEEIEVTTMHGNKAKGFQWVGKVVLSSDAS